MKTGSPQHLSSAQVADLLDERLDARDRDSVVAHLSTCAECRQEVAELHGALAHVRARPSHRRWLVGAAVGAAAVLAFVALPRVLPRGGALRESPGMTRSSSKPAPVDAPSRIEILGPADGALVAAPATFIWRPAGVDASYSLTIQNEAGAVVWSTTIADTMVALPAGAKLTSRAHYFWSVDARLGDGGSVASGAHPFVAP